MSIEAGLLADIASHPEDDALRLVLADWYEEQGQGAEEGRAEFIRLQVERAGLPLSSEGARRRDRQLRHRERQLLALHRQAWLGPFWQKVEYYEFRRGLLERVDVTLAQLGSLAPELRDRPTVREVRLGGFPWAERSQLDAVLRDAALEVVTHLGLQWLELGDWGAGLLSGSAHIFRLRHLDLLRNGITAVGAWALGQAVCLPELRSLNLASNPLGDAGAEALATASGLTKLDTLRLDDTGVTDRGALALAHSPRRAALRRLTITGHLLSEEGRQQVRARFGDGLDLRR